MTPAQLVTEARRLGIALAPNGDKLRVVAPRGTLSSELRRELAEHKPEILEYLSRQCVPCIHERDAVVYLLRSDGCPTCNWTLCKLCRGCLRARFYTDDGERIG